MTVELGEKVEAVQRKQDEQQEEIESIVAFLVKRSMNEKDFEILQKLNSGYPFPFNKAEEASHKVQKAFLCLRDLGLIEKVTGELLSREDIERLPSPSPDLKSQLRISDRGRFCLTLIEKYSQNLASKPPLDNGKAPVVSFSNDSL
jgi:hypothetical protein